MSVKSEIALELTELALELYQEGQGMAIPEAIGVVTDIFEYFKNTVEEAEEYCDYCDCCGDCELCDECYDTECESDSLGDEYGKIIEIPRYTFMQRY